MENSHKRKRKGWDIHDEEKFIEIWENYEVQLRGTRKNTHVYAEMAVECQLVGLDLRSVDVKYKIANLKRKY